MAKHPISWHQECLHNLMEYQCHEVAHLERLQQQIDARRASIKRLRQQIERAIREGKDGFDRDRYEPTEGGE